MDAVVEVKGVDFSYDGHKVLEQINLTIQDGDFLGIMGPNGGGKTTLLKLILGLLHPQKGHIRVFGADPKHKASRIGYVPQYLSFDPKFPITALDAVLLGLLKPATKGIRFSKTDRAEALQALEATGIQDIHHQRFGDLSGGQKQRVLISRALVSNPEILLLDEPTASIDSSAQESIYSLLQELNANTTIVLVSHDLGVVTSCVEKVACVNRNLIVHDVSDLDRDSLENIYATPLRIISHDCIV